MIGIEISHGIIATAYFVLAAIFGLWLVPFLFRVLPKYLPLTPPRKGEQVGTRYGFVAFFVGCGIHHFDFMTHAVSGTTIEYLSVHHILAAAMQVFGALTVVAALIPYVLSQDFELNGNNNG